jgi:hypothetical protein
VRVESARDAESTDVSMSCTLLSTIPSYRDKSIRYGNGDGSRAEGVFEGQPDRRLRDASFDGTKSSFAEDLAAAAAASNSTKCRRGLDWQGHATRLMLTRETLMDLEE